MKSRVPKDFANKIIAGSIQEDFEAIQKVVHSKLSKSGNIDDKMTWLDINHLTDGHVVYDIRDYKKKP